jgi:5-dehydro-4-deoxyglucarate dehydratase
MKELWTVAPTDLTDRLDGILSFPVTAFDRRRELVLDVFRQHIATQVDAGPAAVFPCCGTGEFFSLDLEEYTACVGAAVEVASGRVPVIAGTGYGTALARRFATAAAAAGADGLLAMPPYLVSGPAAGLLAHYRDLAAATGLAVVVYQRDNAVLAPETVADLTRVGNVVGVKDGLGDLDLLERLIGAARTANREGAGSHPLVFLNGMPTAEMTSRAYRGLGVTTYSSAVFCFAPEIALGFNRALRGGDEATVQAYLDGFYRPLVELRQRVPGYAVSLVKAGVRLRGLDVGPVRPPLVDPTASDLTELEKILERGLGLVGRAA